MGEYGALKEKLNISYENCFKCNITKGKMEVEHFVYQFMVDLIIFSSCNM